jgi:hypothetical protein
MVRGKDFDFGNRRPWRYVLEKEVAGLPKCSNPAIPFFPLPADFSTL